MMKRGQQTHGWLPHLTDEEENSPFYNKPRTFTTFGGLEHIDITARDTYNMVFVLKILADNKDTIEKLTVRGAECHEAALMGGYDKFPELYTLENAENVSKSDLHLPQFEKLRELTLYNFAGLDLLRHLAIQVIPLENLRALTLVGVKIHQHLIPIAPLLVSLRHLELWRCGLVWHLSETLDKLPLGIEHLIHFQTSTGPFPQSASLLRHAGTLKILWIEYRDQATADKYRNEPGWKCKNIPDGPIGTLRLSLCDLSRFTELEELAIPADILELMKHQVAIAFLLLQSP